MRVLDHHTIGLYLIFLFCVGRINGQSQQGGQGESRRSFSVPSLSDILSEAISLENAARNFDLATGSGEQRGATTSGSGMGTGNQHDTMNLAPSDTRQISGSDLGHGSLATHGHSSDPHGQHNPGTNVQTNVQDPGSPIITDPFGVPPPVPFGTHVDLPMVHGNNNDFPVIHHGSDPIAQAPVHSEGPHADAAHFHTEAGSNQLNTPSDRSQVEVHIGPSLIGSDIANQMFHGMSVHQTPTDLLAGQAEFVDLGTTPPDLSSLLPAPAVNTLDPRNDLVPALPANPVDIPIVSNTIESITPGTSIFGPDLFDPLGLPSNSLDTSGQAGQFVNTPVDPGFSLNQPIGPVQPGNLIDQPTNSGIIQNPGDLPVSRGIPGGPVNRPVDLSSPNLMGVPTDPFGGSSGTPIDSHTGGAHDPSHHGVHIDAPGQHGNTLNEAALHIPDGMSIEEVQRSGFLDTLTNNEGVPSPLGSPALPTQTVQNTNIIPDSQNNAASSNLEIPMSIPAGMSMEEARRSGILDALAHDASLRGVGSPPPGTVSIPNTSVQTVQNTNTFPGNLPDPVASNLEIPMSIPAGMSMEEARSSGILDALAHDASIRARGSPPSQQGPVSKATLQTVSNTNAFPGSSEASIARTRPEIPVQLPEGMTMEEARRSGFLDALAYDASLRNGDASSVQGDIPQPPPMQPVFPSSSTGHVHPRPDTRRPFVPTAGVAVQGFDPNFPTNNPFVSGPVVPVGTPQGSINVPVPGRMGRRGRWRGRNERRRDWRRRFMPARDSNFNDPSSVASHAGSRASGGLLGELMRTAVQIGTGGQTAGTAQSPWQRQGSRNAHVHVTRSGPIHSHAQPRSTGGTSQGNPLVQQLEGSLINILGNMLG